MSVLLPSIIDNLTGKFPGWETLLAGDNLLLGILRGEGIGPEVTDSALIILRAAAAVEGVQVRTETGGPIGKPAIETAGRALSPEVSEFCQELLSRQVTVLCGPGGGRFVYELRKYFDTYCKITPIKPIPALLDVGAVRPASKENVDILFVREISSGTYQGEWGMRDVIPGPRFADLRRAFHTSTYAEEEVERLLRVAIQLASERRKKLAVILKPAGWPAISALWTEVLSEVIAGADVEVEVLEVDNAAYQIVQRARDFDVVAAPNLFGDILADVGGLLLGARGLTCSGNFGVNGISSYNTGHGACYDLAGRNIANPIGHLLCLCMALRVTYNMTKLADRIERGISTVLSAGFRTPDIASPGSTVIGTKEITERIAVALQEN